ncbi:hypothetical protein H5410_011173, partial [Solanum commersonii]
FFDECLTCDVSRFELDCDKNDLSISYMLGFIEKQKGAPFRIRNDLDLRFFLDDQSRPILRISVVEKIIETINSVVNDEDHHVTTNIPINEEASLHPISTQGSRYTDDDGTDFYRAYRRDVFHDHFEQIRIINAEVADYLENVGFHKWSRAYFPGNRYDVLTSNIAESVNAMFNEAREFSIIALFNDISKR